jgi:hypothetical protein
MALKPLPKIPYLMAERHLRPAGKDCLVIFGGNLYSVPALRARPRQLQNERSGERRHPRYADLGPHRPASRGAVTETGQRDAPYVLFDQSGEPVDAIAVWVRDHVLGDLSLRTARVYGCRAQVAASPCCHSQLAISPP